MIADIVLITAASIVMILGIIGCIFPFVPGPLICYGALWIAEAAPGIHFCPWIMITMGVVIVAVFIIDYYIPIWGTKKFGGTRAGMWGSTLGMVVGMFWFPPWGVVIGPIIGALIGELIKNRKDKKTALKSALGAFVGFLLTTGLKLVVSIVMAVFLFNRAVELI